MQFSKHSKVRMQQRGIAPILVDLLLYYGETTQTHGATKYSFNNKSRKRIKRYMGDFFKADRKLLNAYAVVAEDVVVTVGWRS